MLSFMSLNWNFPLLIIIHLFYLTLKLSTCVSWSHELIFQRVFPLFSLTFPMILPVLWIATNWHCGHVYLETPECILVSTMMDSCKYRILVKHFSCWNWKNVIFSWSLVKKIQIITSEVNTIFFYDQTILGLTFF